MKLLSVLVRPVRSVFDIFATIMPHLPLLQPNYYTDQSEIQQELTRLRSEGPLTPAQQFTWAPQRPAEELYDVQKDPHQINNLVSDPAFRDTLLHLRAAVKAWIISINDTGFLPESYMHQTPDGQSIYEAAQNKNFLPIESLMSVMEITEPSDKQLDALLALLVDPHDMIRYWAALGLLSYAKTQLAPHFSYLQAQLQDVNPMVKLVIAEVLCKAGKAKAAYPTLIRGLETTNHMDLLYAARVVELEQAQMGPIRKAIENARQAICDRGRR